ncbi:hypothetical protein [Actinomadura madurae]|nr:hypothetical protein [Actinomadura madurae]MCP9977292.1 hypothetical protein [Actinomadura madurae]
MPTPAIPDIDAMTTVLGHAPSSGTRPVSRASSSARPVNPATPGGSC